VEKIHAKRSPDEESLAFKKLVKYLYQKLLGDDADRKVA